ncbi:Serine/threonine-protein phosphatase 2A regulatory subunit sur-6 [Globodera pallida]|nr:Serine/threonine-protein phosphatase 2A regulatory subunit sur-6 [Globodera pallida]
MDVPTSSSAQSSPMMPSTAEGTGDELHWRFSQIKGNIETDESPTDADIISCVEFSHDGELLATGDKGGRVVIFQRDQSGVYLNGVRTSEYNVYSTFQSHEPEFDYLKSLEIEEKINQIKWMKKKNAANFIISTNDKTVKLWKISERERKMADGGYNLRCDDGSRRFLGGRSAVPLHLPKLVSMELIVEASPRRVYANAHTYHINSISINSDQETFISADDLRVNLWHHEITNQSFNIVDIKPANMEELTEVITAAEFHPSLCHVFAYSSSKGIIRLCDMRDSALCDGPAKTFEEKEDPAAKSFFSEIISSVSDVKFSHNGRYLLTRDYLTVNVWDLNMESRPVESYHVHDYLRSKLCTLYENDSIFDKFECCWSGDDRHVITGSYNNYFRTFKRNTTVESTYEASLELCKPYRMGGSMVGGAGVGSPQQQQHHQRLAAAMGIGSPAGSKKLLQNQQQHSMPPGKKRREEISADYLDFNKKILHCAWHPTTEIIALAATNNLYIFEGSRSMET